MVVSDALSAEVVGYNKLFGLRDTLSFEIAHEGHVYVWTSRDSLH